MLKIFAFHKARQLEKQKKWQQAFDIYQKIEAKTANPSAELAYRLGFVAEKRKQFKIALKWLGMAVHKNPTQQRWLWRCAQVALKAGDTHRAVELYEQSDKSLFTDAKWHYSAARRLENNKNYLLAARFYHQALQFNPNDSNYSFRLGRSLQLAADYNGAIFAYEEAMAKGKVDKDVLICLGRSLIEAGQFSRAEPIYKQLIDLTKEQDLSDTTRINSYYLLGEVLVAQDRAEEALRYLEAVVEASPKYSLAWFALYKSQLVLGQNQQALQSLSKAAALQPTNIDWQVKLREEKRRGGSWAVVSTIRAPKIMVDKFIKHYINMNASEIHVFMDDPSFSDYNENFLLDERVFIYICNDELWSDREYKYPLLVAGRPENVEGRQFSNYLEIQEKSKVDWILNVDVDELLISKYPISSILKEIPENIFMVAARTLEAVYQSFPDIDNIFSTNLFKNTYNKYEKFVNKEFDSELIPSVYGFWGHSHGKGFFRRSEIIKTLSCHFPTSLNSSLLSKFQHESLELLHFECMTFELFHEKRLRRITGESLTTRIALVQRKRLEYFKKTYEKLGIEGTKRLYSQMNIFSGSRLERARDIGFLTEKEINFPIEINIIRKRVVSYHKTHIIMNINTRMAEAIEYKEINCTSNFPIFIEHEITKSGYAYLYCIINNNKLYVYPGANNELILYSKKQAFFYNYEIYKDYISISMNIGSGNVKFLSIKKNGKVGFTANELRSWEKINIVNV